MRHDTAIPVERIEQAIYLIRGQKVMLDRDLAVLYGVETRMLKQAVTRNIRRFPADFMFDLTREEIRNISQIVICRGSCKTPCIIWSGQSPTLQIRRNRDWRDDLRVVRLGFAGASVWKQ